MKIKLLILLSLPLIALAQNKDSLKVEALRNSGYAVEQTNEKAARKSYETALTLSRSIPSPFLEAGCLIDLGDLEEINGRYENAEKYFRQALAIGQRINSPLRLGSAYLNIGNSWLYRNRQDLAIDNYLLSAAQLTKINDSKRLSPLYANIEAVFFDLENYPKALEYGEKAIAVALQVGNPGIIASAYVNASNTLKKLGRDKESVAYLEKSLAYARQAPEPDHKQDAYQNLADRMLDEKNYARAKNYADSSLHYARLIKSSDVLGNAYNISGIVFQKLNLPDSARNYLLLSSRQAQLNGNWKLMRENYAALADLEQQQGHYQQAFDDETKFAALKDSTFKESVSKQVSQLEARFQTERKQLQINALEKNRQIQSSALRQKTTLIIALASGLLALVVIGYLFYRNNQRKLTALQQEKQLIAMDSILKGQEDERSRMARDLHDGLGGLLSGVKISLNGMQGNQVMDYQGTAALSKTLDLLDNSIGELRRIARNLMPEALLRFGLKDALADFIQPVNDLETGLQIHLRTFGLEERLEPGTEIVVFRIIQELLNNILKHAGATEVQIQLLRDGRRLSISVEDNGRGYEAQTLQTGSGLANVRSRVAYLNGQVDIQSGPGKGTFVNIEISQLP